MVLRVSFGKVRSLSGGLFALMHGGKTALGYIVRVACGALLLSATAACATEMNAIQAEPNNTVAGTELSTNLKNDQMKTEMPEALSGFKFDGNTVVAEVISHGCTRNDDFNVDYSIDENQCKIRLTRVKPDLCRRAPMLQTIKVQWQAPAECESLPIVLLNPILVAPESGLLSKRLK